MFGAFTTITFRGLLYKHADSRIYYNDNNPKESNNCKDSAWNWTVCIAVLRVSEPEPVIFGYRLLRSD